MINNRNQLFAVVFLFLSSSSIADVISFGLSISEMDNECQVVINEAENGELNFIKDKSIVVTLEQGSYAGLKSDLSIRKGSVGGKEAFCSVTLYQRYFNKSIKFCAPSSVNDMDTEGVTPRLRNSGTPFSLSQGNCSVGIDKNKEFIIRGSMYSTLDSLSQYCSYMCLIE